MMWREFNGHFKNPNRVTREISNHHDFINWENSLKPNATPEVNFRLGNSLAAQRKILSSTNDPRGVMSENPDGTINELTAADLLFRRDRQI